MSGETAAGFVHPDDPGAVHVAMPGQSDGAGGVPDILRMHCGRAVGIRDDGELTKAKPGFDFVDHEWAQNGTCTPCVMLARLQGDHSTSEARHE